MYLWKFPNVVSTNQTIILIETPSQVYSFVFSWKKNDARIGWALTDEASLHSHLSLLGLHAFLGFDSRSGHLLANEPMLLKKRWNEDVVQISGCRNGTLALLELESSWIGTTGLALMSSYVATGARARIDSIDSHKQQQCEEHCLFLAVGTFSYILLLYCLLTWQEHCVHFS